MVTAFHKFRYGHSAKKPQFHMSCFGVSVVDSVYDDVSECLVDENTPIQEESCHRF